MKYDRKLFTLVRDTPKARERKNKNRTVAYVLQQKHPALQTIELNLLEIIIKESGTLDRQWRKMLEEYPAFRGNDYGDKKKLEQEKMIELGYEPTVYRQDKHIKNIIKENE